MNYIDQLTVKVAEIFNQTDDKAELQNEVVELIHNTAKESFKNGLKTASQRKSKGQQTSQTQKVAK